MFRRFLLFLVVVPFVELAILLGIAAWLGWPTAMGLVIVPSLVGVWVMRRVGEKYRRAAHAMMLHGQPPADPLSDGLLSLLAAVLLLVPGVLTDLVGLALLIRPLRHHIRQWFGVWIEKRLFEAAGPGQNAPGGGDRVIDARLVDVEPHGPNSRATP